jgi:RNA polymerase sigma-70 factor, ECF subfamily
MTTAESFEAFVRRYQDMVFAGAVRLLGNPTDAEDVAQTVFLRAFQQFSQLDGNPAAAGWLKTTTRNACLNHLTRYRGRWRLFSEMDGEAGAPYEEGLASRVSHALETERADAAERLERAVWQLPDHQRVPLVLFHFDELSYEEIATTLGVSLGKVKTDIHRGRQALKRLLLEGIDAAR